MTRADDERADLVPRAPEAFADELPAEVGRFVGTVLGSASMGFNGILGDRVAWWRFRQWVRLAKRAKALCDAEELEPSEVPLRIAVPLLEKGSLADEPELADRFAALLANAATQAVEVTASYVQVLSELEPRSALLLDSIYDRDMRIAPDLRATFSVRTDDERTSLGFTREEHEARLDDLARLGLLRSTPGTPREVDSDVYRFMSLTAFGRDFVAACRPPNTPTPPVEWADQELLERRTIETEPVSIALERLARVLNKNGTVRKALVRYVVSEACVDQLRELIRDVPHGIPLRSVGRYLAELEQYAAAKDAAMEIRNLQERAKLGAAVMEDFAAVRSSVLTSPPDALRDFLIDIYTSLRQAQREQLEKVSARHGFAIPWPTQAPEP